MMSVPVTSTRVKHECEPNKQSRDGGRIPAKRFRRASVRRKNPKFELLECRRLLAASLEVTYRDFPFTVTGTFTGDHNDTYRNCSNPPQSRPYRDQYSGSATVSGTLVYGDTQNNGIDTAVSLSGSSIGADNFWSSYRSSFGGSSTVAEGGGLFTFAPNPSSTNVSYSDIVESDVCATFVPEYVPGLLGLSTGSWSLTDPSIRLVAASSEFNGTLQSLTTGTTNARVVDAFMGYDAETGLQCLKAEFEITGAFPQVSNSQAIGKARGVLVDGFGVEVETLFEQDVFWNTGTIVMNDPAFDLPAQGSGLDFQVSIEMQGDQIMDDNIKTVPLTPDLVMRSAQFEQSGIRYTYEIVGPDAPFSPDVSFYWSADDKLDSSDERAVFPKTAAVTSGIEHSFRVFASDFTPPKLEHNFLIVAIDALQQLDECNEGNNHISLALAPVIDVSAILEYPPEPLAYNSEVSTTIRFQNDSPIPLHIKYAHPALATEDGMPDAPIPSDSPQVEVAANSSHTITTKQRVFWEWIPQENPLNEAVQKFQDPDLVSAFDGLIALLEDVASAINPVVGAALKAKSILTGVTDLIVEQVQLRNADRPNTQVFITLRYQPQVAGSPVEVEGALLDAEVPERKTTAYEHFLLGLGASRVAVITLGEILGKVAKAKEPVDFDFLPTSTLSLNLTRAIDQLLSTSSSYQKALDPPNFDYQNFANIDVALREELDNATIDPAIASDLARSLAMELGEARNDAVDRSDGANQDGERSWLVQQLASTGGYVMERIFAQVDSVRLQRLLAPVRAIDVTPEEIVAYWDENDSLPDEIRQAFVNAGLLDDTVDALLSAIRDRNSQEIAESEAVTSQQDLWDLLSSADELLTVLADCIALKVSTPVPLMPDQQAKIQMLRLDAFEALDQTTTEQGQAADPVVAIRQWIENAWQLALETGQYSELSSEINDALLLLIRHATSQNLSGNPFTS